MLLRGPVALLVHACCAAVLAACSVEGELGPMRAAPPPELDAGRVEAPPRPIVTGSTRLMLRSEARVRLGFGERVEIEVQLLDRRGEPLRRVPLGFDLVGRPEDAVLARIDAMTDGEGVARTELVAGQRIASFRVRASAVGAVDLYVDASVSAVGFGTLLVQAPYDGARMVTRREVLAFSGMTCAAVDPSQEDRALAIPSDEPGTRLVALPASDLYAIVVLGSGPTGVLLATGCSDSVPVRADQEQKALVTLLDLPLALPSAAELELQLSASAPAIVLSGAVRRAIQTVVRRNPSDGQLSTLNAEGRFWLDSLDASLRASTGTDAGALFALADSLAAARQAGGGSTPEGTLSGLLSVNAQGMEIAAEAMSEALRVALSSLVLHGALHFEQGAALATHWTSERMLASPVVDGGTTPEIELSALEPVEIEASLSEASDGLELTRFEAHPRFGGLAVLALRELLRGDSQGLGEPLQVTSGCPTLAEWLSEQSFVDASACGFACVAAACELALARVVEAAEQQLEALDDARPALELAGTLLLADENGDGIAEQLASDALTGEWRDQIEGASGEAVTATVVGMATAEQLLESP